MKDHGHKTLDCSMAFVIMQVGTGKASTRQHRLNPEAARLVLALCIEHQRPRTATKH